MKRLIVALVLVCLAIPASGEWPTRGIVNGTYLGSATHTPNTETTWASTPDDAPTGVVIPSGTKAIMFTVKNYPIRVMFGSRAATASVGIVLNGDANGITYSMTDPNLISEMRFIDTSAGASSVFVIFLGED